MKITFTNSTKAWISLVLVASLALPALALAYGGGGGGGGGGETDKDINNRTFDDEQPGVPDISEFLTTHYIPDGSVPPTQPVVLTDLDQNWGQFWNDNYEAIITALDEDTLDKINVTGSVATWFIPGAGWYKGVLGVTKAALFISDPVKRAKVQKALSEYSERMGPSPQGYGTGNTASR